MEMEYREKKKKRRIGAMKQIKASLRIAKPHFYSFSEQNRMLKLFPIYSFLFNFDIDTHITILYFIYFKNYCFQT